MIAPLLDLSVNVTLSVDVTPGGNTYQCNLNVNFDPHLGKRDLLHQRCCRRGRAQSSPDPWFQGNPWFRRAHYVGVNLIFSVDMICGVNMTLYIDNILSVRVNLGVYLYEYFVVLCNLSSYLAPRPCANYIWYP
jgi:hypothetical protein